MKKKYQILLYPAHDLDLITFRNIYKVNLSKAVYCSLRAFCRGETFVICLPQKREHPLPHRRKYRCQLTLDTIENKKEIEMLSKIANGYRNNFLKNLLRMYIRTPLMESFLNDKADFPFFMKQFEIFKQGLRRADAASMKKNETVSHNTVTLYDYYKGVSEHSQPITDIEQEKEKSKADIVKTQKKEKVKKNAQKKKQIEDTKTRTKSEPEINKPENHDEEPALQNAEQLDEMFSKLF